MALSPTETATEMYRNSIANVRKSGKQATAGPQTTTQASKTDKGEVNAAIGRYIKNRENYQNYVKLQVTPLRTDQLRSFLFSPY